LKKLHFRRKNGEKITFKMVVAKDAEKNETPFGAFDAAELYGLCRRSNF
jgi:hypothetical protein